MAIVLNLENTSGQKFQSKSSKVIHIKTFEFRTESDKPKNEKGEKPRTSKVRHPKGPQKVEKVKDEEDKNDKEETYCFCSQVKPLFITLILNTV